MAIRSGHAEKMKLVGIMGILDMMLSEETGSALGHCRCRIYDPEWRRDEWVGMFPAMVPSLAGTRIASA